MQGKQMKPVFLDANQTWQTRQSPYTTPMPWEHIMTTTIELQNELAAPLQELAERMHTSQTSLANQAVKEFLAREQTEAARWADTEPALQSIRAGQVAGEPEVHAWLASWGSSNEPAPPIAQTPNKPELIARLRSLRGSLSSDGKFDRLEANERQVFAQHQ